MRDAGGEILKWHSREKSIIHSHTARLTSSPIDHSDNVRSSRFPIKIRRPYHSIALLPTPTPHRFHSITALTHVSANRSHVCRHGGSDGDERSVSTDESRFRKGGSIQIDIRSEEVARGRGPGSRRVCVERGNNLKSSER